MGVTSSCVVFWTNIFCFETKKWKGKRQSFPSLKGRPYQTIVFLVKPSSALLLFPYSAFCHHHFLKTLLKQYFPPKSYDLSISYLCIYLCVVSYLCAHVSISLPANLSVSLSADLSSYLSISVSLSVYSYICLPIDLLINITVN